MILDNQQQTDSRIASLKQHYDEKLELLEKLIKKETNSEQQQTASQHSPEADKEIEEDVAETVIAEEVFP